MKTCIKLRLHERFFFDKEDSLPLHKWETLTSVRHRYEYFAIILLLASEGVEELCGETVYK